MTTPLDPLAPVVMTFSDKVANNAEIALKSGSTYVVLVAGILGALYASMSTAQQTQLVEAWPVLRGWTPVITVVVAFIVTKLKPSNTVSAATQTMLTELATLRLNAFLRARGSTELPDPQPAPLPVALAPIVVPAPPAAPPAVALVLAPPRPIPTPMPAPAPATIPLEESEARETLAKMRDLLTAPSHADAASHLT